MLTEGFRYNPEPTWPNSANIAQIWPTMAKQVSNLGQCVRHRPNLAESGPNPGQLRPKSPALGQTQTKLLGADSVNVAQFGPNLANELFTLGRVRQKSPNLRRFRANLGRNRRRFDCNRTRLAKMGRSSAETWPKSAEIHAWRPNWGNVSPKAGGSLVESAEFKASSPKRWPQNQNRPTFQRNLAGLLCKQPEFPQAGWLLSYGAGCARPRLGATPTENVHQGPDTSGFDRKAKRNTSGSQRHVCSTKWRQDVPPENAHFSKA